MKHVLTIIMIGGLSLHMTIIPAQANEASDLQDQISALEDQRNQMNNDIDLKIKVLRDQMREKQSFFPRVFGQFGDTFTRKLDEGRPYGESDLTLLLRRDEIKVKNNDSDDTWGITGRLEWPMWREFSGAAEFNYHYRQYFPYIVTNGGVGDPKGFFGNLRGYGGMGSIIFRPKVGDVFSPYLLASAGGFWWDFHENPFLQDEMVEVDVDSSVAYRVGGGFDLWISRDWALNFEMGYFDTKIPKRAFRTTTGQVWHILGDNDIGNEQIQISVGARYRF